MAQLSLNDQADYPTAQWLAKCGRVELRRRFRLSENRACL